MSIDKKIIKSVEFSRIELFQERLFEIGLYFVLVRHTSAGVRLSSCPRFRASFIFFFFFLLKQKKIIQLFSPCEKLIAPLNFKSGRSASSSDNCHQALPITGGFSSMNCPRYGPATASHLVQVRTLSRPLQNFNVAFFEPFRGGFTPVMWIIVLLCNPVLSECDLCRCEINPRTAARPTLHNVLPHVAS